VKSAWISGREGRFIPVIIACLLLSGCPRPEAESRGTSRRRPPSPTAALSGEKEQGEKQSERNEKKQAINAGAEPSGARGPGDETGARLQASEDGDGASDEGARKPRDLGPPLVDHPESLTRLHPAFPVWIDKDNKQVVLLGEICQTNAPLEMFACTRGTKEHESIVSVPTEAYIVHAALLSVGARTGKPVAFQPKYIPATGSEIEITVRWKNDRGEIQTARAQDWVRNVKTGMALEHPWVFGGSGFWKDESSGKEYYQAEGGDFICVANFPSAMLDLPIESSESNEELLFQAYRERIPARGTAVTLILRPKGD
jgi:hypothetical protein